MASFFEQQAAARRNSRILVLLYAAAVIAVIVAVDLVVATAYLWLAPEPLAQAVHLAGLGGMYRAVPVQVYAVGALATALVILGVSAWQVAKLAAGGRKVAELVGARRVRPDTQDLLERRYLNVVEEMAIAAGMRVPAAYVMDAEAGINAFAAGYEVSDAVVAVTRGALETLDRDELQGVIGHEFSHILNGDMRLNIRMLGLLAGIVFIGQVGEFLLRAARGGGRKGGAPALAGLALLAIGYVGLFFARLIKAAVSRQHEFLADAASVQFTRDPDAIAGALDRIRSEGAGALVRNLHAEDLSHMFFAEALNVWFASLFATHPPIEERIRRVHPRFERQSYRRRRAQQAPADDAAGVPRRTAAVAVAIGTAQVLEGAGRRAGDPAARWQRSPAESAALAGTLDGDKVAWARRLLAALAPEVRERLRTRAGARSALLALVLAPREEVMRAQLEALAAAGLESLAAEAAEAAQYVHRLAPGLRLAVTDLALPALKAAPEDLRSDTVRALEALIHADRRVSLQEFVLLALVRGQLLPAPRPGGWPKRIADLRAQAALALALVAYAGARPQAPGAGEAVAQAAIAAGAAQIDVGLPPVFGGELTPERAAAALEALRQLAPLQKAILVRGLFAAATHDGTIRLAEAELLRMVGAVLDCPLPPLLETLDPATLPA